MRLFIALIAILPMLQQTAIPAREIPSEQQPVQKIIATVFDSQGRVINGLRATDFIVQENGVQKEISQFLPDS